MDNNQYKNIYCFSHANGKLRTDEIKELLRARWSVIQKYHTTKNEKILLKDIKKLNKFVEHCERKHYNGALFGERKTRKFEEPYPYNGYNFKIRCINHHMTISFKTITQLNNFFIADYSSDNILMKETCRTGFELVPKLSANKEELTMVMNDMLHLYNTNRPSNPFIIFYLNWDQKKQHITTRHSDIYQKMIEGFCYCYKSFKPDDFSTDFIIQEQNLFYNRKKYDKTGVTANYLSLLTGINYYTTKTWTDTFFMGDISFRNFVKISQVLNGTDIFYEKYLSPKISTAINPKYYNGNLAELRLSLDTTQEIFASILGISRKHYVSIEKNPDLLGDQSVQSIYNLAKFCDCRVIQLFPMHLIKSYQDQAKDIALKFLLSNPPQKNSTLRKRIIIDIHTTST
jgi:Predicted transcriptional regulators